MAPATSPKPRAQVTRAEIEALTDAIGQLAARIDAGNAMRQETHAMVTGLHRALMEPEPGHQRGLLDRMAAVTIAAETGTAAGERIIWWAKIVGAAVTIGAGIVTFFKLGWSHARLP